MNNNNTGPSGSSSDPIRSTNRSRFAMAHRLKMMEGGDVDSPNSFQPSAKVIRPSPNHKRSDHSPIAPVASQPSKNHHQVFKADRIFERDTSKKEDTAGWLSISSSNSSTGFPSLNAAIGTFASRPPKYLTDSTQDMTATKATTITTTAAAAGAEEMLRNMTPQQIQEGIDEIHQILSPTLIHFLKHRKRQTVQTNATVTQDMTPLQHHHSSHSRPIANDPTLNHPGDFLDEGKEEDASPLPDPDEHSLQHWTMLLRSTSYRQVVYGAKRIYDLLRDQLCLQANSRQQTQKQQQQQQQPETTTPLSTTLPVLLPVALRCLLDLPSPHKHEILYSHVLPSLCFLILRDSLPVGSHLQPANKKEPITFFFSLFEYIHYDTAFYQQYFMDDSVVNLGNQITHNKETEVDNNIVYNADNYSTTIMDSQSESAMLDGQAFYRDPMWTCLTRMRILPTLAKILKSINPMVTPSPFTIQTIQSICGILHVLSRHYPGAACAVAQNTHLLPSLVSLTLQPQQYFVPQQRYLAIATLQLLITIAQQSRIAASAPILSSTCMEYVCAILPLHAESTMEYKVQKLGLVFWRTLLRYGLATIHANTMMQLAITHQSTASDDENTSLVADYASVMAALCDCVTAHWCSRAQQNPEPLLLLTVEEKESLDRVPVGFIPSVHSYIDLLLQDIDCPWDCSRIHVATARWKFLSSFSQFLCSIQTYGDQVYSEYEASIFRERIQNCIHSWIHAPVFHQSLQLVLSGVFTVDWDHCSLLNTLPIQLSTCCLIGAVISTILLFCGEAKSHHGSIDSMLGTNLETCFPMIMNILTEQEKQVYSSMHHEIVSEPISYSMQGECFLRSHFVIAKFLSDSCFFLMENKESKAWINTIRSFALILVGRLQTGHEALLMIILQQPWIFSSTDFTKLVIERPEINLQSFLLQELCREDAAKYQTSHSYRRFATQNSFFEGPFTIETLRPDVNVPQQPHEHLRFKLPLGNTWAYRFLSSTVIFETTDVAIREKLIANAISVLASSFQFILFVEGEELLFIKRIHVGTKLYHLFNTLLYPEEILRDEKIPSYFMQLFSLYVSKMDTTDDEGSSVVKGFYDACYQHSALSKKTLQNNDSKANLLEIINPIKSSDARFTPDELKAMDDFVSDLSTVYLEYGAQYEPFTRVFRFFLRTSFPTQTRNSVITKIADLLQRLQEKDYES